MLFAFPHWGRRPFSFLRLILYASAPFWLHVCAFSFPIRWGFYDLPLLPSVPLAVVHYFPACSMFGSSVSWRFALWVLASLPWSWAFLSLGRSTMLGLSEASRHSSSWGVLSLSCYSFVEWFLALGVSPTCSFFFFPLSVTFADPDPSMWAGPFFSSILLAPSCPLPLAVQATGAS